MGVEIIWSDTHNGYQISDDVVYEEAPDAGISPTVESLEKQLYIRHTNTTKISSAGFYIAKYDSSYTGGSTREKDLAELLEWGSDSISSLHVDTVANFNVSDTVTGATSGATATLSAIDATDVTLCVTMLSGTFQDGEIVSNGGTGTATISSITDAGIYINQNYLGVFSDEYVVLTVDDASAFAEGSTIIGSPSYAVSVIVKVEGNDIIVTDPTGEFLPGDIVSDDLENTATVSSVSTRSAWTKFKSLQGSDKSHAVPVTIDAMVGGHQSSQINGEIFINQSVSVKFKVVAPSELMYTDLSAYTRQFATALTYKI